MLLVKSLDWNNQLASYGVSVLHYQNGRVVVLTELDGNPGMPIPQAAERYLQNLQEKGLWHPDELDSLCFVEHLPAMRYTPEHFQRIVPRLDRDNRVYAIDWTPLDTELKAMIADTLRCHTPIPLRDAYPSPLREESEDTASLTAAVG
ncbi:hypothetical protein [Aestuariirhabdus litorea]|uniref:Uncharacterized protein n=1 Tax=Aestuariirhabdus litorea TaxID=2528527 RepID=A0A3P3VPV4_9GAMM|nr:hypothetical protein [Aestuariirhabdus litorea]RRJ84765.1 hypothetical protein D0544_06605 [Aestuariirhabdus litorea]RWW97989.1 hypothetical protein DZC74_06600 [Endozoicomonadaceae bacterium GTF-13]